MPNLLNSCLSSVERISTPSYSDFIDNYVKKNIPVILVDGGKVWGETASWNLEYILENSGDTKVNVEVSPCKYFPPVHEKNDPEKKFTNKTMLLKEYVGLLSRNEAKNEYYYVAQQQVDDVSEKLSKEAEWPSFFKVKKRKQKFMWFSGVGNTTPLHYDFADNLFLQVIGHKKFILFPPKDRKELNPYPANSYSLNFSQVDIEQDGSDNILDKTSPVECVLKPGELLFVPMLWWHQVYSKDLSLAISYWSKPIFRMNFHPLALRMWYFRFSMLIRSLFERFS